LNFCISDSAIKIKNPTISTIHAVEKKTLFGVFYKENLFIFARLI